MSKNRVNFAVWGRDMAEKLERELAKSEVRRIVGGILETLDASPRQFCTETRIAPVHFQRILQSGHINLFSFAAIIRLCRETALDKFAEDLNQACTPLIGRAAVYFAKF
jgi:hypothetical protein